MNNQHPMHSNRRGSPLSLHAAGSAYGVRIRHHKEHYTDALYYWNGCGLSLEDKSARQSAVKFSTLKEALEAAAHVRDWMNGCGLPIEWHVCRLPSWRLVKRSMPNAGTQRPGASDATIANPDDALCDGGAV